MGANWKPRWKQLGGGVVGTVATVAIAVIAKNDLERAKRESPEGRLQAVHRMMRPHEPAKGKEQVVARKAAVDASLFSRDFCARLAEADTMHWTW